MSGPSPHARDSARDPLRSAPLKVLVGLLFAEALALAGLTAFLLFEILTEIPDSYAAAIGITILAAIATLWLSIIAINTLRGFAWVRGAIVTMQVLQIAVAIGSFQGLFARTDIGWLLLVPAVAVLALLFSRPVMAATARRGD